jgi:hypothetical protein
MFNINHKTFMCLFIVFIYPLNLSAMTQITVWEQTVNGPTEIIMDTLYRALEITKPEYGDYQLFTSAKMEQGRALRELSKIENAQLDLAHFAPTKEREKEAIVVRFPLIQGLLGYRVCLIKEGEQQKFSNIANKSQWINNKLSVGQHKSWPDTLVLKANGLPVKTSYKYELLFQQLAKNRFDCFARGANEIVYEYDLHQHLGLEIEKEVLLHYPFPLFFFVNKSKPALAKRLEVGLSMLIENGIFEKLFDYYYQEQIINLNLQNRHIIELQNPTLSYRTIQVLKQSKLFFKQHYLFKKNASLVEN